MHIPGKVALLLLALSSPGALGHPDLVGEHARDLERQKQRTPQENEMHSRYLIQGTSFFGSPVHEELTIRSVTLSGILGRPFRIDEQRDRAFLRGVFWNDDPEADLWSDDKSKGPDSLGIVWYSKFNAAKERATADPPYFHRSGDSLLGRSHFGDLQFVHAMANVDGIVAAATFNSVMMWLEFSFRVASGEIPGNTRIADVPVPGIAELFEKDPSVLNGTVSQLFRDASVREVAAGSVLHVIQDSFAGGHARRTDASRVDGKRRLYGKGSVLQFHAYAKQDENRHKADDGFPPTLRLDLPLDRMGSDPVYHGANLLRMMFGTDGSADTGGKRWPGARSYLLKEAFPLADPAVRSSAGDCYAKGPLPPKCSAALASRDPEPRKIALLIGIDDYLAVSKLKGAVNDALNMKAVLMQKFFFAEEDIRVLLDRDATRAGIEAAVKELVGRAEKDSVVVLHFSGHGSQAPDMDDDELDGWDETIVPYDSRQGNVFDITDDEINAWIRKLNEITPNVVLIMDSCHSGTGARVADVSFTARYVEPDPRLGGARLARAGRDSRDVSVMRDSKDVRFVAIGGSRAEELSYEYEDANGVRHGALTYFLVRALRESGAGTTYRDVHERVLQDVSAFHRLQHPQIDGANLDQALFASRAIATEPFHQARAYGDAIVIDAGRVHGITPGTTFRLYAPGTKTFRGTESIPLGKAKATEVSAYGSQAARVGEEGFTVVGVMRAVEDERSVEDFKLRVHVAPGLDQSTAGAVLAASAAITGVVQVGPDGEPHLVIALDGGGLTLMERSGAVMGRVSLPRPDLASALREHFASWLRWYRILDISNPGGLGGISFDLLSKTDGTAVTDVCVNGKFQARLRNGSNVPLHFSLLALGFNGEVKPLISIPMGPGAARAIDLQGDAFDGPGPRVDYIKLIATDQPIDLSPLKQPGARSAQRSALGRLLQDTLAGQARVSVVPAEDWTTMQRRIATHKVAPYCSGN